jgi:hypothetical protein
MNIKGANGKMSGRVKPYLLMLCAVLMAAFLLNPPVAFATKLPTVCNIFHDKKTAKSGPCGHQVTFSKDKFQGAEMAFSNGIEFENIETPLVLQNNQPSRFFPSAVVFDSVPLRC